MSNSFRAANRLSQCKKAKPGWTDRGDGGVVESRTLAVRWTMVGFAVKSLEPWIEAAPRPP